MSDNIQFYNETLKRHISFEEVVEEIVKYVNNESGGRYKITVGTDSEGSNETHFVTAIAVLRVGNGGKYFWTKSEKTFCPTLRDRIYKETMHSIMFVQELKSQLKDRLGEEFFWPARQMAGGDNKITVHLDVGKNGPTKDFIENVVGMVKGYGFEAIIKPDSFCAFVLADRHT
ncbi:MAG: ribonuclease H-like YkuK family protein [Candidatus Terrybacteria bacterium]|nr:ribonuclease H-like YkuK family protein [Candidatus Terrybacteria bacterium]